MQISQVMRHTLNQVLIKYEKDISAYFSQKCLFLCNKILLNVLLLSSHGILCDAPNKSRVLKFDQSASLNLKWL